MFDRAWYQEPMVLFKRPLEFFPARDMTHAERLNAIVRFIAYASVGIAMYKRDPVILAVGAVIIVVLSLVFSSPTLAGSAVKEVHTEEGRKECTPPTPDNPFMNVLANEYMSSKPGACAVNAASMQKSSDYFDEGLPREIADVYHNRASDRQFITMPASGTNGTPDTLAFRNFLFSETAKGPKCKSSVRFM